MTHMHRSWGNDFSTDGIQRVNGVKNQITHGNLLIVAYLNLTLVLSKILFKILLEKLRNQVTQDYKILISLIVVC